jgi:Flp pilus assembly protein TadB
VTSLVLLGLAVVWAAFLLPSWFRRRREGRPADSVLSFRRQLSTLERATPGGGYAPISQPIARHSGPRSRAEARRRRRDVFYALLAATVVSLLLAMVMQGPMLVLFVLCLGALGAYTALLVQIQRRTLERVQKVRPLRPQTVTPDPAYLLRRSVSNG